MSKYAVNTPSREEFYEQIKKQREREQRKKKLRGINWFMIVGVVLILAGVYVYYKTDFMLHDLAGVLIGALGVVPILGRFMPEGEITEEDWERFKEFRDRRVNDDIITDPAYSSLLSNIYHRSDDD